MLIRCTQSMNNEINKFPLFHEFRSEKWAWAVTSRVKSIQACSPEFFSATSPNQKIRGVELHERIARKFVDELLTAPPGNVLLLADAYASFLNLVKQNNLEPVKRSDFKAMVAPFVQEKFAVCLRNDLKIDERTGVRGWKNVGMVQTGPG